MNNDNTGFVSGAFLRHEARDAYIPVLPVNNWGSIYHRSFHLRPPCTQARRTIPISFDRSRSITDASKR